MIYQLDDHRVTFEGDGQFVAPNATVVGRVTLRKNASIWFNVVIRGDSEDIIVGEGSNVQDGTVLHADPGFPLIIGKDVTIGHQAMVHGCTVGDGSLIGINAVVLNGAVIGKGCLIGANALVTEGTVIPDGSMVLGSPAKIVRQLDENMQEGLRMGAQHYVENGHRFLKGLKADD